MRNLLIYFFTISSFCAGCQYFKKSESTVANGRVVAKVDDQILLLEDLAEMLPRKMSATDSIEIIQRYIDNWTRKKILIKHAKDLIAINEKEIEKKLQDYKEALIIHEFEKKMLQEKLDTKVSEQEIQKYYQENSREFELKQNIIRGAFVKLPSNSQDKEKVRNYLANKNGIQELKNYNFKQSVTYSLDDSLWIDFDEVIKDTPMERISNKVDFLKQNKFVETKDSNYVYFLRINAYKIADQISPLAYVKERVISMIINTRKAKIIKELENELYQKAKKNNEFQISYP